MIIFKVVFVVVFSVVLARIALICSDILTAMRECLLMQSLSLFKLYLYRDSWFAIMMFSLAKINKDYQQAGNWTSDHSKQYRFKPTFNTNAAIAAMLKEERIPLLSPTNCRLSALSNLWTTTEFLCERCAHQYRVSASIKG